MLNQILAGATALASSIFPTPLGVQHPTLLATLANTGNAGYMWNATPGAFSSANGTVQIPAINCASTPNSGLEQTYVQLDGYGTASYERSGIQIECDGGAAAYFWVIEDGANEWSDDVSGQFDGLPGNAYLAIGYLGGGNFRADIVAGTYSNQFSFVDSNATDSDASWVSSESWGYEPAAPSGITFIWDDTMSNGNNNHDADNAPTQLDFSPLVHNHLYANNGTGDYYTYVDCTYNC